jgi:DNA-binding NtrC family response regulator
MTDETKANISLLFVDDEPMMRNVIKAMFGDHGSDGITVKTADSAASALRMCDIYCFDIVVTDIFMEPVNGIELAEDIIDKHCIPVILCSGKDIKSVMPDEVKQGMVCCLMKPFSMSKIKEAVTRVYNNSRECVTKCKLKKLQEAEVSNGKEIRA